MPTIEANCETCGALHKRRSDRPAEHQYCSRACSKVNRTWVTKPCEACGTAVSRCRSQMLDHVFCSRKCSKGYLSKKMADMNDVLNPERMTMPTRTKLRAKKLNTGKGISYEKTFGRHTHRIVAEEKLGRPLRKGEVVHHEDEQKRNNKPENLKVFQSQAEHARHHKNKQSGK